MMIKLPGKNGYYWISYYGRWVPAQLKIKYPGRKKELYLFSYLVTSPIKNGVRKIGEEIKMPERYR